MAPHLLIPMACLWGLATLGAEAPGLARERAGSGPGVVLIHGFGGHRGVWGPDLRLPGRTTLALDLPGVGDSPPPAGPAVDFGAVADRVAATLERERLGPTLVVAHSMGGLVAVHLAGRHPDLVTGLVLIDVPLVPLSVESAEALARAVAADPSATFRARFAPFAAGPAQVERVLADMGRTPRAVLAAYARGRSTSLDPVIRRVACPVLVLASPVLLPRPGPAGARPAGYGAFRDLQVLRFPRARHWVMWDDPPGVRAAVAAFADQVEGRRP